MKQIDLVNAYNATERLSKNDKLPSNMLWSLYKLRKFLAPHMEFQEERQKAILEKYKDFADEDGNISGEPYNNYMHELNDLLNMEIETENREKEKISLVDDLGLSIQMMEALEPFIEFEK